MGLMWPPQSPDLNPIENLWTQLKIKISELEVKNFSDLPEAMERAWKTITTKDCENLVASMPNRIDEVLKNKGGWTKY